MSDELTDTEKDALQYRFSGYELPKIQLDLTGDTCYQIDDIHPYYKNQPEYWGKPFFQDKAPRSTTFLL